MAISFINPDNNLLLGEDTLEVQGLNGVKEIVIMGPSGFYLIADGIEISEDGVEWTDEIFFEEMEMRQPLFLRPTTSTEGRIISREADDVSR